MARSIRKTKKIHELLLLRRSEYLRSIVDDAGLSANIVALGERIELEGRPMQRAS